MGQEFLGFDVNKAWDYENGFYLTSHITRISKLLAHFELYKSIVGLPGHIVECGVYKAASLIRFATFREILENPYSRKIIGFDAFGKFPHQEDPLDRDFIAHFEKEGGDGISIDELNGVLKHKDLGNIELVEGDILETVPRYADSHPELKISLLHIDVDVYRPTRAILDQFFGRIVPGGLLILDDYGTVPGETRAVDEFLSTRPHELKKLPFSHIPVYLRKGP